MRGLLYMLQADMARGIDTYAFVKQVYRPGICSCFDITFELPKGWSVTANNDWTMDAYGVVVDKRQSYDRRGVSLGIIYQFNPRKSKYKGKAASESEMDRL